MKGDDKHEVRHVELLLVYRVRSRMRTGRVTRIWEVTGAGTRDSAHLMDQ